MVDRVIPRALDYSDITPEIIDSEIKLHKFTPMSNVSDAKPGEVIRFMLNANAFLDPYSTYLKFTIKVNL